MPIARCPWADSSPVMCDYHDREWGVPSHDDRHLFEMLTLEDAQAGLSWATILNRRDEGIIRNRLKIYGTRTNAQAVLRLRGELGSFATYLWKWVDGTRIVNHPRTLADLRPTTDLSDRLSRDLKRRGFTFVGSTIVYSLLEAVGIVDDHLTGCPFKRH